VVLAAAFVLLCQPKKRRPGQADPPLWYVVYMLLQGLDQMAPALRLPDAEGIARWRGRTYAGRKLVQSLQKEECTPYTDHRGSVE